MAESTTHTQTHTQVGSTCEYTRSTIPDATVQERPAAAYRETKGYPAQAETAAIPSYARKHDPPVSTLLDFLLPSEHEQNVELNHFRIRASSDTLGARQSQARAHGQGQSPEAPGVVGRVPKKSRETLIGEAAGPGALCSEGFEGFEGAWYQDELPVTWLAGCDSQKTNSRGFLHCGSGSLSS